MANDFTNEFLIEENSKFKIKNYSTSYKGKLTKEEGENLLWKTGAKCGAGERNNRATTAGAGTTKLASISGADFSEGRGFGSVHKI